MRALRWLILLPLLAASGAWAQRWGGWQGWGGGERWHPDYETCRTAREVPSHSTDTPVWTNAPGFDRDTFTFTRVRRDRADDCSPSAAQWWTDFPDSDLNLSFRLQQVTSVKVDPDGRVLRLTDPELVEYPWIYMVEPGSLLLRDEEIGPLRAYLLNGGVLMADDFWGEWQWNVFEREIRRVLPEGRFVDLPPDHAIFRSVFDLSGPLNRLQTPNIGQGVQSQVDDVTFEVHNHEGDYGRRTRYGERCTEMHLRAILDQRSQIQVLAVHNCDNGDGWEREGEDDFFFHQFSEKRAYPLGINILFHLMTH